MTPPPPPRGRRDSDDELEHVLRRRRRRRERGKGNRKRRTTLVFVALVILVLAVIASSVGAVARFRSDCDLQTLTAVQNGQNSFVYAATGTLLGSIPAGALIAALALTALNYAVLTLQDQLAVTYAKVDIPRGQVALASFVART